MTAEVLLKAWSLIIIIIGEEGLLVLLHPWAQHRNIFVFATPSE